MTTLPGIFCTLTDSRGRNPANYRIHHVKNRQYAFWKLDQKCGSPESHGKTMHIADLDTMRCQCKYKQFHKSDGQYCRHLLKAQELENSTMTEDSDNTDIPLDEIVVSRPTLATDGGDVETAPPMQLIQLAIEKGVTSVDVLSKLFDLQERYEQRLAEVQYTQALASAQGELQPVAKKGSNQGKAYPKLEDVQDEVTPVFSKHGLTFSFYEGEAKKESDMRICCLVRHIAGYKHEYFLDLPMDGVGTKGTTNKTPIHAKVSAASYGQRKLLLMISNLRTVNEDKDGGPIKDGDSRSDNHGNNKDSDRGKDSDSDSDQTDEVNAIHELVHELRLVDRLFVDGLQKNYGVKRVWDLTKDQRMDCWNRLQTYKSKKKPEGEERHPPTPVNGTGVQIAQSGGNDGVGDVSTRTVSSLGEKNKANHEENKVNPEENKVNPSNAPTAECGQSGGASVTTVGTAGRCEDLLPTIERAKAEWSLAVSYLFTELDLKKASYRGQMMRHGWQVCSFDPKKDAYPPDIEELSADQVKHLTALVKQGPNNTIVTKQ